MWYGQQVTVHAAEVAVERRHFRNGGRACGGHGHCQNRIRAQLAFVWRAVELDHGVVDGCLLLRFHAQDGFGNFFVDMGDGFRGSLAEIPRFVIVTKLDGFVLACRGSGGHSSPADTAIRQMNVCFDGRIAAGVKDLPPNYFYYFHKPPLY